MKTFTIAGIKSLVRISDDEGKLVAYVGGNSLEEAEKRAELIIDALEYGSKAELVNEFSTWVYDMVDTLSEGRLAMQLAYLYPAIFKGHKIEITSGSPLYNLLKFSVRTPPQEVWNYIDVIHEEEES